MFVLKILAKDIRKELVALCSIQNNSILRSTEPSALQTFSWDSFLAEVKETAPTLLTILDGLLEVHIAPSKEKRKKTAKIQHGNKAATIGLCTAILYRYRNQSMNLVEHLLSIFMYKGGANKQVWTITIMCVSKINRYSYILHSYYDNRCLGEGDCKDCWFAYLISVLWPTWTNLERSMMLLCVAWSTPYWKLKQLSLRCVQLLQSIISVCSVFWLVFTIQVVGGCGHTNSDLVQYWGILYPHRHMHIFTRAWSSPHAWVHEAIICGELIL